MTDITFILTDPVNKIIGGYKMVYIYANALASHGYKVNIVYRRYKRHRLKIIDIVDRLIRKYIFANRIRWFKLDKTIQKVVVEDLTNIPSSDIYIVTALPTVIEYKRLYENKRKTIYFIQDFENWGVEDDVVYSTYQYEYPKIVVSKWLKEIVDQYSNVESVYIPNGIDLDIFKVEKSNSVRRQHSLAMLYHTQPRKGTQDGLEVIRLLKEKYEDLEVELFGSPEQPKDLPKWIHYKQNASPKEVAEIFNRVMVFMCPSKAEGFGLTGLESIACGCALVSTPCKGVLEYATNRHSALITSDFSNRDLYDCVCEMFDNQTLKNELITNALKDVKEFDVSLGEKKFTRVVEELINKDI